MALVRSPIRRNALSATRANSPHLVVSCAKPVVLACINHPSVANGASTAHPVLLRKESVRVSSRPVQRVMRASFPVRTDVKLVLRADSQRRFVVSPVRRALRGSSALWQVVQAAWNASIALSASTEHLGVIDAHPGITSWKRNASRTETDTSTRALRKRKRSVLPGVQIALPSGTGDATTASSAEHTPVRASSFALPHLRGVASSRLATVPIRLPGLRDVCL